MEAVSAACIHIAVRRAKLPLSMVEVADAAGLPPHHAWLVYRRVLSSLEDKTVPAVDPSTFILRAVAAVPALATWQGEEGPRRLVADSGTFLRFAETEGLLTGRHPLAVTVACILMAARVHQVAVSLERVCAAVHAVPSTALRRFKELLAYPNFLCPLPPRRSRRGGADAPRALALPPHHPQGDSGEEK